MALHHWGLCMEESEKMLSKVLLLSAFSRLDELLSHSTTLILGGGSAMILAHQFPLATSDVDAIPRGIEPADLEPLVKKIAVEKNLPGDWLNPHFAQFAFTIPSDFGDRLIRVFSGSHLFVDALGKEDMLILKCFAHRKKDIAHARKLLQLGADLEIVESQIELLLRKKIKGAQDAFDFLDDLLDQKIVSKNGGR